MEDKRDNVVDLDKERFKRNGCPAEVGKVLQEVIEHGRRPRAFPCAALAVLHHDLNCVLATAAKTQEVFLAACEEEPDCFAQTDPHSDEQREIASLFLRTSGLLFCSATYALACMFYAVDDTGHNPETAQVNMLDAVVETFDLEQLGEEFGLKLKQLFECAVCGEGGEKDDNDEETEPA